MARHFLHGPPEFHTTDNATLKSDIAVSKPGVPSMGFTENRSVTYLSTGKACLDFFFPDTLPKTLTLRLETAWAADPLTALKLIFNLRGVRGTGKSDKQGFYTAALWLPDHHPKTLALNIEAISEFVYLKDSLEILYRLLEGAEIREKEKEELRKFNSKQKRRKLSESVRSQSRLEKTMAKAKKALGRYHRDPHYRFLHDMISSLFANLLKKDMEY